MKVIRYLRFTTDYLKDKDAYKMCILNFLPDEWTYELFIGDKKIKNIKTKKGIVNWCKKSTTN